MLRTHLFTLVAIVALAACGPSRRTGDACEDVTCSDHGTCTVGADGARCTCEPGFAAKGTECVPVDVADPCANVTCSGHGSCAAVEGAPTCRCETGFHASALVCLPDADPCEGVACSGRGSCVVQGGAAACACNAGFHADGLACVADASPCAAVNCSGRGTCVVTGGGPSCVCESGFHADGLTCVADVDPCAGVACSGHGRCQANSGQKTCVCDGGWHAEGLACVQDVDPCAGVACSGHGTCRASGGAPICVCEAGYFPQGLNCEIEDPCATVTCLGHETCAGGDCVLRPGRCDTSADCSAPKTCDAQHTCVEPANPCAGVTCSGHGTCESGTGTAVCRCDAGYVVNGLACSAPANPCDGVTCSGHGACAVSGASAVCACESGYLASGLNCVASPCNGVTCSGKGTCAVTAGAAACSCQAGYRADGLSCVAETTACTGITCSGHGTCSVVSGAATCACEAGYTASGTTCVQSVAAGDLILSELMPDPSATTDTLGEWIEIHNPTDRAIPLQELAIRVGTSTTSVTVSASIPAKGHFVVARSVDAKVPYGATAGFSNLANGGGVVAILMRGRVLDEVRFPAASAGKSFQLSLSAYTSATHADFSNWCVATRAIGSGNADLGTPGGANLGCSTTTDPCTGVNCNHGRCVASGAAASCTCDAGWSGTSCNACASGFHVDGGACVPNVAPTGLVVNEFLASPAVLPDAVGEWVELHNAGASTIALDTLELVVNTSSYPIGQTGRSIAPGGYFVIARSAVAPLPNVGAIMNLSLPSSGTNTLGLKLNGVAVGTPVALGAPQGAAWQRDGQGAWCAARTPIGAGNADLGTPGAANVGCATHCVDRDGDGKQRRDAFCPAGADFCDGDPAKSGESECAACTEGALRAGTEACGLNFEGVYEERCTGGRWAPAATCTGTATCIEGLTRSISCGETSLSSRTEACTNGAWTVTAACSADECGTNVKSGDVTIRAVTDITALAGVTAIDGKLTVNQADRVNLQGLSSLRCVRALALTSNSYLQSLSGLENLTRVSGAITITYNHALTSIGGLSSLRSAGSLTVEWNNRLTAIELPALAWVHGDLRLSSLSALTSLSGLRSLRGVTGLLEISTAPLLQDLSTGGALRVVGGLRLASNPELRSLAGLTGLAAVLGGLNVTQNDHVYFEITSGLNLSYVKDSITISHNRLMDSILGGFDALCHVGGNLYFENAPLRHFAGFSGLRALGGTLQFVTSVVYDVEPVFPRLRVIEGDVKLNNMGFIADGLSMPKVERVGGSIVADNAVPSEWKGLDALRVVGGDLVVRNSSQVQKLHFPSLQKVLGSLRIMDVGSNPLYRYNAMLADVANLDEVGVNVELKGILSMNAITGLEKLTKVGGALHIDGNRYLTSLTPLAGLRSIGGNLLIRSNAPVASVRPLLGLTRLGGNLTISEGVPHCDALALKDHLILNTGWTGTATITGTAAGGTCP